MPPSACRLGTVAVLVLVGLLAACASGDSAVPAATVRGTTPSAGAGPDAPAEPVAATVALSAAGDEFNNPATLADWVVLHGDILAGPPSTFDIGMREPGSLTIVAADMVWLNNSRGFYLFKQVSGDFVVTTRIRAEGRDSSTPTVDWSLTGLLLRAPVSPSRVENWVGYTVGHVGGPRIERKTTRSNRSVLRLAEVAPGWIELRAVRAGKLVALLHRQADQPWTLDGVYARPDLPAILQVGINAGTGYESATADLVAQADWIRFAPTGIPAALLDSVSGRVAPTQSLADGNALSPSDTALVRTSLLRYFTASPDQGRA